MSPRFTVQEARTPHRDASDGGQVRAQKEPPNGAESGGSRGAPNEGQPCLHGISTAELRNLCRKCHRPSGNYNACPNYQTGTPRTFPGFCQTGTHRTAGDSIPTDNSHCRWLLVARVCCRAPGSKSHPPEGVAAMAEARTLVKIVRVMHDEAIGTCPFSANSTRSGLFRPYHPAARLERAESGCAPGMTLAWRFRFTIPTHGRCPFLPSIVNDRSPPPVKRPVLPSAEPFAR